MRYVVLAAGLAAASVAVQAQNTAWGFFDGENGAGGAGVSAPDGSQLMIKCNKTGKGEVHGMVYSVKQLMRPTTVFERRDLRLRFDDDPPFTTRWRYYDNTAMAVDQGNEKQMTRLAEELIEADTVEFRFDPKEGPPIELTFDVRGARAALAIVYERCKDVNPIAAS
jgi:hypothetical protein